MQQALKVDNIFKTKNIGDKGLSYNHCVVQMRYHNLSILVG